MEKKGKQYCLKDNVDSKIVWQTTKWCSSKNMAKEENTLGEKPIP